MEYRDTASFDRVSARAFFQPDGLAGMIDLGNIQAVKFAFNPKPYLEAHRSRGGVLWRRLKLDAIDPVVTIQGNTFPTPVLPLVYSGTQLDDYTQGGANPARFEFIAQAGCAFPIINNAGLRADGKRVYIAQNVTVKVGAATKTRDRDYFFDEQNGIISLPVAPAGIRDGDTVTVMFDRQTPELLQEAYQGLDQFDRVGWLLMFFEHDAQSSYTSPYVRPPPPPSVVVEEDYSTYDIGPIQQLAERPLPPEPPPGHPNVTGRTQEKESWMARAFLTCKKAPDTAPDKFRSWSFEFTLVNLPVVLRPKAQLTGHFELNDDFSAEDFDGYQAQANPVIGAVPPVKTSSFGAGGFVTDDRGDAPPSEFFAGNCTDYPPGVIRIDSHPRMAVSPIQNFAFPFFGYLVPMPHQFTAEDFDLYEPGATDGLSASTEFSAASSSLVRFLAGEFHAETDAYTSEDYDDYDPGILAEDTILSDRPGSGNTFFAPAYFSAQVDYAAEDFTIYALGSLEGNYGEATLFAPQNFGQTAFDEAFFPKQVANFAGQDFDDHPLGPVTTLHVVLPFISSNASGDCRFAGAGMHFDQASDFVGEDFGDYQPTDKLDEFAERLIAHPDKISARPQLAFFQPTTITADDLHGDPIFYG